MIDRTPAHAKRAETVAAATAAALTPTPVQRKLLLCAGAQLLQQELSSLEAWGWRKVGAGSSSAFLRKVLCRTLLTAANPPAKVTFL